MANEDIKLVIPSILAQQILNYLLSCPCGQVMEMVTGLQKLPRAIVNKDAPIAETAQNVGQATALDV